MLILIAPLLLFTTAATLVVLQRFRPAFRSSWLIAVAATSLAWLSIWLWQPQLPLSAALPLWQQAGLLSTSPSFSVDSLSWIYAISLVALALAVLLTAPARAGFPSPYNWAISLGLTGLGLIAVMAGNPVTLVLTWAALDLAELLAMLRWSDGRRASGWAITVFSVKAAGTAFLVLAEVLGSESGKPLDFLSLPPQIGSLLLGAAAIRLAVLPFRLPYSSEPSWQRGIGTTFRLVSAAASLVLLSHIPMGALAFSAAPVLLALCGVAALYASWMWLRSPDEIAGRPFWIVGLASLAIACALRGSPSGATAWGAALILSGGVLFLASARHTWLNRGMLIGGWALSALPFSLTAAGWRNDAGVIDVGLPALLVGQALLLTGYLRRAASPGLLINADSQPPWIKIVYPVGIWTLLLIQILLGLWGWAGAFQAGVWIAGGAATILCFILLWAVPRIPALNPLPADWMRPVSLSTMDQPHDLISRITRGLQSMTETITRTLEGEAGIMWSLLLLILFVSLIAARSP